MASDALTADELSPFAAPLRRLDPDAVPHVLRDRWGLDVRRQRRLDTERDDSFVIEAVDVRGEDVRVVVKVAHPADTEATIDLQLAALEHVAATDPGLPVPRIVADLEGEPVRVVLGVDGEPRRVRVLTYLEGAQLDYDNTDADQRTEIGRAAGRLSRALADFTHPAADRALVWDLQQAHLLRAQAEHVPDDVRELVHDTLDTYDATVGGALRATRQQVVHHDLNPDNLLVDRGAAHFVTGLLDFGDLLRSSVVGDLAVCMAYAVDTADDPSAWGPAFDIARGFDAERPLEPDERALLPELVRLRLAQRLVVNCWLAASDPANAHYTARSVARAAQALRRVVDVPPPLFEGR